MVVNPLRKEEPAMPAKEEPDQDIALCFLFFCCISFFRL